MKSLKSIKNWTLTKSLKNNNFSFKRNYVLRFVPSLLLTNAFKSISSWKNYKATPLIKLDKLQKNLKVNNVFYKDESKRFHLKSFKALGGAYAVERISKGKKNITISSATAGNHGKSVAWGTKRLGLKQWWFEKKARYPETPVTDYANWLYTNMARKEVLGTERCIVTRRTWHWHVNVTA